MTAPPFSILLVEDNPADIRLTREAFKKSTMGSVLTVVKDGVEAMSFLRPIDSPATGRRPDLIFLDLNLPKKDGRQVLAEIKRDPDLRRIPVLVFTTSQAESDITASYDLNANCYIVKPANLDQYFDTILSAERFWLSTVTRSPR